MDIFRFRWGVKEWDVGYTIIPNPILEHYAEVPWVDGQGNIGKGISNQEMMFIIHLASFKYEAAWSGPARPSLSTTLRDRMGYSDRRSVINLKNSLVSKNLLDIYETPGLPHEYNLAKFSHAILAMK